MKDNCIFCQITKGEIPSTKVFEDKDILAFKDIHPLAPVHILIIPKKHIVSLSGSGDEDIEILGKIQRTAAKIARDFNIDKAFRVLTANGENAGQSVFHLHYHLIGGWKKGFPAMEGTPQGVKK